MSLDAFLEPPQAIECCQAFDCVEADEEGNTECRCENHECSTCGGQCQCRCDSDYEAYKESQMDRD
jgi:hypothetical protein